METELNNNYFEHFMEFWVPIYRRQVLNAKYDNDKQALKEIYDNIDKNWHLQDTKEYIHKKLGLEFMSGDIDSQIIGIYFKHKKKKELLYDNTGGNM